MATIHNSEVQKKIMGDCKIQTSVDEVPSELASKVVPTINVNPARYLLSATATGTGNSLTVHTNVATKRTLLWGFHFGYSADATCDATSYIFQVIKKGGGVLQALARLPKVVVQIESQNVNLMFPVPMELEPGSGIATIHTKTAGNHSVTATAFYEERDADG